MFILFCRMEPETTVSVKDPEISSISDLKRASLVRGYVKHVGAQGVFIRYVFYRL